MLNPDGYVYTWDADRLWRKNRRPRSNDPGASFCQGVDLNRNYGAGWKTNAEIDQEIVETLQFDPLYEALNDECGDIYRGTEPFSEPETRAHMEDMRKTENIVGYLTYHSYGEMILYPLGMSDTSLTSEDGLVQLESIAKEMQGAIKSVHNHTYQYGEIKEILYEAPGSCVDWVFLEENVPLSFGIELRPKKGNGYSITLVNKDVKLNHPILIFIPDHAMYDFAIFFMRSMRYYTF